MLIARVCCCLFLIFVCLEFQIIRFVISTFTILHRNFLRFTPPPPDRWWPQWTTLWKSNPRNLMLCVKLQRRAHRPPSCSPCNPTLVLVYIFENYIVHVHNIITIKTTLIPSNRKRSCITCYLGKVSDVSDERHSLIDLKPFTSLFRKCCVYYIKPLETSFSSFHHPVGTRGGTNTCSGRGTRTKEKEKEGRMQHSLVCIIVVFLWGVLCLLLFSGFSCFLLG